MKTLIIWIILGLSLTACSSIPPLMDWAKPSEAPRVWDVKPEAMPQFASDRDRCTRAAWGLRNADALIERCMIQLGWNLKVAQD